ncbi:MAG: 6-phosphofructokinase [Abditibacteriota bacterium]|nr:6-phosphofructokinase [Abditibacteriota bacterium]MBP5093929.1 6-phosphofructokinase [Abditibacteriota bacterium]
MKRIAVMTSGGDSPGMNACVRSVVRCALAKGIEVMGVKRGYYGLINNDIAELDSRDVGGIIRQGGTMLMSARCLEFKTEEGQKRALDVLGGWDIEGMVVIGGDGSLTGAKVLSDLGFPTVGVPASIDNDINGTDSSIGVDTALNTILDAIDKIKDTASAHQRTFIIEVMGRAQGYLAMVSGIVGGAEIVVIPGQEPEKEKVIKSVKTAFISGKPHYIAVVAEGANSADKSMTETLASYVREAGYDVRVTVLGHVQRGGSPSAFDRLLATRFGASAVEFLLDGKTGVMTGLQGRKIVPVPFEDVIGKHPDLNPHTLSLAGILAK